MKVVRGRRANKCLLRQYCAAPDKQFRKSTHVSLATSPGDQIFHGDEKFSKFSEPSHNIHLLGVKKRSNARMRDCHA